MDDFGIDFDGDICAEAWLLSCHKDGKSTVEGGEFAGKTLDDVIAAKGKEILGTNCSKYEDFPILIKLIDAKKPLSIQVHPDEEYARKHENQHGKTEMWYVLDAFDDAFLYQGFEKRFQEKSLKRESITTLSRKCFTKFMLRRAMLSM